MILRSDQEEFLANIRAQLRIGQKRILGVAPTGFGKGVVIGKIVESMVARGKRGIFVVKGRELVADMSRRLDRLNIDHGVIMANASRGAKPWLPFAIASIDTLHRRENIRPADLLIADEAHLSLSNTWQSVFEKYPDVPLLGMTATPILGNGAGLGSLYKALVLGPSVADMITAGNLVPSRVFAPSTPDVSGVRVSKGEFNQVALAAVVDKPKLTGDLVTHWKQLAPDRKTVAFAVDVKHSQHIAEQFRCAGIEWVHVDAETPDYERDRIWKGLASGSLRGVSSVGVVNIGWDCPPVSCAISARPTASLGLFLQQWGRVLRTHPGKKDAIYLDHSGNCERMGMCDDPRDWSLEDGAKKKQDYDPALAIRTCKQCWCAFSSREPKCPACGLVYVAPERTVETVAGELKEVTRFVCSDCRREMPDAKEGDWCNPELLMSRGCRGVACRAYQVKKLSSDPAVASLQKYAQEMGYKPGWLWHRIQELKQGRGEQAEVSR